VSSRWMAHFHGTYRRRGAYRGDKDGCQRLYGILVAHPWCYSHDCYFLLAPMVSSVTLQKNLKERPDKQNGKGVRRVTDKIVIEIVWRIQGG